jgi:hypothetical protein
MSRTALPKAAVSDHVGSCGGVAGLAADLAAVLATDLVVGFAATELFGVTVAFGRDASRSSSGRSASDGGAGAWMNAGSGCFGIRLSKNRIGPRARVGSAAVDEPVTQAAARQRNTHGWPRKIRLFRRRVVVVAGMNAQTGGRS